MKGNGVIQNFKKLTKVRSVKGLAKHVYDVNAEQATFVKSVVFNRKGYSPAVLQILDKFGSQKIIALRIYRMPLSGTLMNLFDVVTLGSFSKRVKNEPYEKLFHLRLDIKTENGKLLCFEKTSHISMEQNPKTEQKSESVEVSIIPDITVLELVENTRKFMGDAKFWIYQSRDQNCQDLQIACAKANNYLTPELQTFIKQDVHSLFDGYLRKLANTATELNGRVEVVMAGAGLCDCCKSKVKNMHKHNKTKKHLLNST